MKAFDFQRFVNLWSFYHPRMLVMWLITCGLLVIAYIGLVCNYIWNNTIGFTLFSSIISYACFAAPFVFALGQNRSLQIQLPVTTLERIVVMGLFCFIVVPLGLTLFWEILESIGHIFNVPLNLLQWVNKEYIGNETELQDLVTRLSNHALSYTLVGLIGNFTPMLFGLSAACIARKSPMMSTIFGLLGGLLVLAVVSGVSGAVYAFTEITTSDLVAIGEATADGELKMPFLLDMIKTLLRVIAIFGVCVALVGLPLLYRIIKKQQIV